VRRNQVKRLVCTRRRFCDRLNERLNDIPNHGKGITELIVTKLGSGKTLRLGAFYKTKEKDRGLMLTFCPWCGTNLLELYHLAGTDRKGKMPQVAPEHAP
jgi:hypothetical protein